MYKSTVRSSNFSRIIRGRKVCFPYTTCARYAINCSPFAIRYSPFAICHLLFAIRHSPFDKQMLKRRTRKPFKKPFLSPHGFTLRWAYDTTSFPENGMAPLLQPACFGTSPSYSRHACPHPHEQSRKVPDVLLSSRCQPL